MNLKNMTKSAEGTVKDPGRNLKQKSGLNRSLARVAPYGMRMAIQWALFKADGRSSSSIRSTRARLVPGADTRVQQIDRRRRISVANFAAALKTRTSQVHSTC